MRLLLLCFLAVSTSFLGGAWMMTHGNPEVTFWSALRDYRDTELQEKRARHPDKKNVIFAGGSSCAFGIIPKVIEQKTGYNCMNYGEAASSGILFIIDQAMLRCQPGDLLILALEPHFLVEADRCEPTQLGVAMEIRQSGPSMALTTKTLGDDYTANPVQLFQFLRPGARYTATWVGKSIKGDLSYRYHSRDWNYGGWLESDFRQGPLIPGKKLIHHQITSEAKALLRRLKKEAEHRQIKLAYHMPWLLTASSYVSDNRHLNSQIIAQVSEIIPVLDDPNQGVIDRIDWFSDSEYHLNAFGANQRTSIVANSILIKYPNPNTNKP